jgi:hypothetical protein
MQLIGVCITLLAAVVPTIANAQFGAYEFCVTRVSDSRTEVFKAVMDLSGGLALGKEAHPRLYQSDRPRSGHGSRQESRVTRRPRKGSSTRPRTAGRAAGVVTTLEIAMSPSRALQPERATTTA